MTGDARLNCGATRAGSNFLTLAGFICKLSMNRISERWVTAPQLISSQSKLRVGPKDGAGKRDDVSAKIYMRRATSLRAHYTKTAVWLHSLSCMRLWAQLGG